jgi:hypothetical protein
MTIEDLLGDVSPINKDMVAQYENTFGLALPIEIQRIISYESGTFSYQDNEYKLQSPEKWRDKLDFFGFNFDESGLVPLLSFGEYDLMVVCYDPKEKSYLFKELSFGTESDEYTSLIELLNAYDSIIQ